MKMKNLVILSGAGMSAESGIKTFREMGGLWEEYDVMEVASPQAWEQNPELVMRFYNERRKKLFEAEPNEGHKGIAELEKYFNVQIVTQNVDDLHERAGSTNVLHLHGELKKVRSTIDPNLIYTMDTWELKLGDKCKKGSQLRPHIVWFGESVPAINEAALICEKADVFVVIGTSLNVYPAAGLINYTPSDIPKFLIDPNNVRTNNEVTFIKKKASSGIKKLTEIIINKRLNDD
jgi:NAD-dependent deacetylase